MTTTKPKPKNQKEVLLPIADLPKVVWGNEKIRIIQIPKWETDGSPIFVVEQSREDALGNPSWNGVPVFETRGYICCDIRKHERDTEEYSLLWHLLLEFCDVTSRPSNIQPKAE
jgi:hypothetical protein